MPDILLEAWPCVTVADIDDWETVAKMLSSEDDCLFFQFPTYNVRRLVLAKYFDITQTKMKERKENTKIFGKQQWKHDICVFWLHICHVLPHGKMHVGGDYLLYGLLALIDGDLN